MSLVYLSETVEFFPYSLPATVEEPIRHTTPGRIEFQASYWFAEWYETSCEVEAGAIVNVIGRRGITLLVVPFKP